MPIDKLEAQNVLRVIAEEFETSFPGIDPIEATQSYCVDKSAEKMKQIFNKLLGHYEPRDFITLLAELNEQTKKKGSGSRGQGGSGGGKRKTFFARETTVQ